MRHVTPQIEELQYPSCVETWSLPIIFRFLSHYPQCKNETGAIPDSLGQLTNLTWLNLSSNQLTGESTRCEV